MIKLLVDALIETATAIAREEIPKYQYNECYTVGAFDLLLAAAQGPQAYELLTELCNRVDELKLHEIDMSIYYDLLAQVARQSNTTEMPPRMRLIIESDRELSKELSTWYRYEAC